jgi:hypothetical protein
MDQNTNYQGTSKASPDDNSDKRIKTSFYTLGAQYMIDHEWGLMVEAPFFDRSFTTDPGSGVGTYHLSSLGDAQIQGMYTGFSPDHSTGLTFGLKLPTGEWRPKDPFDRDTMPGTGSTDLILGAYHFGSLTDDGRLSYFTQGKIDIPILTQNALGNSYRPGNEFGLSTGLTYDLASYGAFTKIAPLAQVLYSHKNRDSGTAAFSSDSGYDRIYVSPGLDVRIGKTKIYADVEIPVYTKVNFELPSDGGNGGQLVAPILYKIQIGYDF